MANNVRPIAHRGIDATGVCRFNENSLESYMFFLERDIGLEIDVSLTSDGELVVFHDRDVSRLSAGADRREVQNVSSSELRTYMENTGGLATLSDALSLLENYGAPLSALHVKRHMQVPERVRRVVETVSEFPQTANSLVLFDLDLESACDVRSLNPKLRIAPSIAHSYDVARFGKYTGATLLPLEYAAEIREVFDWVWLDEWDRTGPDGHPKELYTAELFGQLRKLEYQIAVVSPELHATSPGLLGNEAHPDAESEVVLQSRVREILSLGPDALCTDYALKFVQD